jgi:hypothetical protein
MQILAGGGIVLSAGRADETGTGYKGTLKRRKHLRIGAENEQYIGMAREDVVKKYTHR